ncbi:MAG: replication protein [Bacillota bacterium]
MENINTRKYLITFNNPKKKGFTHEAIKIWLETLPKSLLYWCMCDEIGEQNKMYHTHLYLHFATAFRLSTLKKFTKTEHIDIANGTAQQVRDYIRKEGKNKGTKKEETNLKDTFEEWGELPIERQGKRNDIDDLYDLIKAGASNYEILEQSPQYLLQIEKIDKARQVVKFDTYKKTWRTLEVTYIYGKTATGKTRGVMEKYGYENVFRVTDYSHPFDSYLGQDVVIFEEFRSSLKIEQMLNLLDGYPLELPCRYANKVACYTKVFILSNIPIHEQYSKLLKEREETWQAFKRRIHKILNYNGTGIVNESQKTTMQTMIPLDIDSDSLPF